MSVSLVVISCCSGVSGCRYKMYRGWRTEEVMIVLCQAKWQQVCNHSLKEQFSGGRCLLGSTREA